MVEFFRYIYGSEEGQDIAEYAVMLAVILVLVIGTVRLIGGSANNVFSSVASNVQERSMLDRNLDCSFSMTRFRNFREFGRYWFTPAAQVRDRSRIPR
jgi:Flp pilus assembly pilin Flp